jgi:Ca2+-transporting ATPase
MTAEDRQRIATEAARLAGTGMRVLGLAMRDVDQGSDLVEAERELVLVGLAVLRDPLRPEAADTVRAVSEAGVRLVMVTGDHAGTASAVAAAVGLVHDGSQILTGADVRHHGLPMDPATAVVYARVDPEQKLALVEAFQKAGHVVAVTGDGVNDAPALRRADIGVAMGKGGSDVAREAADLIITSDDLGLVTKAVREGRAIFDNIRKVVDYLVAGNLSEIMVVVAGLAFFPGLGVPLLPLQLLWINLLTDGLPALALGFDRPRDDLLRRPPRLRTTELLTGRRVSILAIRAVLLAGGAIGALAITRVADGTWEAGRTVMFMTLVIAHLLYAYVVRLPSPAPNPRLAAAVGLGLLLQSGTVLGPARDLFGVVPITPANWLTALVAGLVPVGLLALYERTALARRIASNGTHPAVSPETANRREP